MSFGPTKETKNAMGNLSTVSAAGMENSAADRARGGSLLNLGGGNVASGTNFFNTLLGGNQANTTALLQPSIDQIRAGNTHALQALSTLMPRGGGRSGTLFDMAYAPQGQIQSLFNSGRLAGAQALPSIGAQQQSLGANLFNIGNQGLGLAANASGNLADISQRQQQMGANFWSGLGGGLFNLATLPLGGGTLGGAALGGIGNLFKKPPVPGLPGGQY